MTIENITIRETENKDQNIIFNVEKQAFGYDKEAQLTDALLNDSTARPFLSLLAFHNEKAVGHILFTRVYMNEMSEDQPLIHILAPLAVIPEYQKQGIGGMLIKTGLDKLKKAGSALVFVLGHIGYYDNHGFIPDAGKLGYQTPYPISEEFANAWMVQSLKPDGFTIKKGTVICANELNKPEHWRE
ncbi:N-acetyltransferase [uncultured Draconibacterium sp.]|uniref:GNAT family N-acetyltransferase n=1 Tax=uncultured Draconibacterium sp. TaxID=1573823 RepID=UPI002AA795DE|nr:N-acetyltransferase [uncultured Draconibacterium sp.]